MTFRRERPALAELLPATTLRDVLKELHSPMRGALQAGPGSKAWCRGCGGVQQWPCVTRRLLDGEDPSIAAELEPVGEPYDLDGVTA